MIRVVVADDHPVFRYGLMAVLDGTDDIVRSGAPRHHGQGRGHREVCHRADAPTGPVAYPAGCPPPLPTEVRSAGGWAPTSAASSGRRPAGRPPVRCSAPRHHLVSCR